MTQAAAAQRKVRDLIPWAINLLDYTDKVCSAVNDSNAGWRTTDSAGNWYFSLLEQVMHIADTRFAILKWIGGEAAPVHEDWCTHYGGTDEIWTFRAGSAEEVLASLGAARAQIDALLDETGTELLEVTPALQATFDSRVAQMKEAGQDTGALEARGAAPVVNQLLFMIAHEQSHRSVLQHHLRISGNEVPRLA